MVRLSLDLSWCGLNPSERPATLGCISFERPYIIRRSSTGSIVRANYLPYRWPQQKPALSGLASYASVDGSFACLGSRKCSSRATAWRSTNEIWFRQADRTRLTSVPGTYRQALALILLSPSGTPDNRQDDQYARKTRRSSKRHPGVLPHTCCYRDRLAVRVASSTIEGGMSSMATPRPGIAGRSRPKPVTPVQWDRLRGMVSCVGEALPPPVFVVAASRRWYALTGEEMALPPTYPARDRIQVEEPDSCGNLTSAATNASSEIHSRLRPRKAAGRRKATLTQARQRRRRIPTGALGSKRGPGSRLLRYAAN